MTESSVSEVDPAVGAPAPGPAPAPAPAAEPAAPIYRGYPGRTLGVWGLALAYPLALLGLILSIVAAIISGRKGFKNPPAVVGIILSLLVMVATGALVAVAYLVVAPMLDDVTGELVKLCAQSGGGTFPVAEGVSIICE